MTPPDSSDRLDRTDGLEIFGGDAAGYHSGRIGYPAEMYDALMARTVPRPDVLEIGAGSGIATEELLSRDPASLTVVEPAAELIGFIRDRLRDPRLRFVTGPFPGPEPSGTYDLAVCAAAFHWLDPQAALARVLQLLRPGGVWAMWWNSYRNVGIGDPLSDAIVPLLDGIAMPPSEGPTRHYSLDRALHENTLREAGFGDIEHQVYRRERILDTTAVLALYRSYSYVRLLSDERRDRLLDGIAHIVEREFGGQVPNIVLTASYSAVAG